MSDNKNQGLRCLYQIMKNSIANEPAHDEVLVHNT